MKKIVVALMAIMLGFSAVYAAKAGTCLVPEDQDGKTIHNPAVYGCEVYRLNASSVAVMITSPSYTNDRGLPAMAPTKAECVVYGVAFSSLTPTTAGNDYVILRDSTTPGRDMTHAIAPELYPDTSNAISLDNAIWFVPPIHCTYGLSAVLGKAGSTPEGSAFIYYRFLDKEK